MAISTIKGNSYMTAKRINCSVNQNCFDTSSDRSLHYVRYSPNDPYAFFYGQMDKLNDGVAITKGVHILEWTSVATGDPLPDPAVYFPVLLFNSTQTVMYFGIVYPDGTGKTIMAYADNTPSVSTGMVLRYAFVAPYKIKTS